jgi:hypothetical protein
MLILLGMGELIVECVAMGLALGNVFQWKYFSMYGTVSAMAIPRSNIDSSERDEGMEQWNSETKGFNLRYTST